MSYIITNAIEKKNDRFFSEIEGLPLNEVRRVQNAKLQHQLTYLEQHSVFYQRRLREAGVDWAQLRTLDDLARVPFTVKQDLRDSLAAAPPFGEHLAADIASLVQMQASSGTTGSPAYVGLTRRDVEIWTEGSARTLFAGGIRAGDRVLHALSLSKGFVGGLPVFQAIQYLGALDLPIGADGGVDRLLVACRDLRPQAVFGTPNFLIYLAESAPKTIGMTTRDLGVKTLIVGGEPGGGIPALRNRLEDLWGGAKVAENMGGTDLGVMYWAECEHQRGMHMVSPDFVLAELIDPETGQSRPFEPGNSGELVYTALEREASPVLRFRSGDHVQVQEYGCPCGRTGPTIRCVGRTDDMLIVRGVNLFPSAVQEIVGEMRPAASGIMRVFADFEGHSTQSNLKVIVERGQAAHPSADHELKTEIERRVRNRLSVKAEVTLVDYETFERPGVKKVSLTIREFRS